MLLGQRGQVALGPRLAVEARQRAPGPGLGRIHHDRLVQVFSHIVGNSFKFGPDGGQVRIEVSAQDNQVRFVVADDGPGMPPDELANLFDRTWQADRKSRDGIGLGLSIVKGIVEAHRGVVEVENVDGDAPPGCRFRVLLPA